MSRHRISSFAWLLMCGTVLLFVLGACGSTGQVRVNYPLLASGRSAAKGFDVGTWRVELDVARLAFGPLYLCATSAASAELCTTALSEVLTSGTVDLLADAPQEIGRVVGTSGNIRSAMYDFGITWTTTQVQATAMPLAPGGHSIHIEGRASRNGVQFRFVADVDLFPPKAGFRAVQGRRVSADVSDSQTSLLVKFDATQWWNNVDFEALAQSSSQSPDVPVVLSPTSPSANAIIVALTTQAPPTFQWMKP